MPQPASGWANWTRWHEPGIFASIIRAGSVILSEETPNSLHRAAAADEAARTVSEVGKRIRALRQDRRMTLQTLADMVDLSPSMLSMVERGVTSPSLATLAALAHGLGTTLTELIVGRHVPDDQMVTRFDEQPVLETPDKVLRRVLKQDTRHKVKITFNEYGPNIGNSPTGITHTGYEYGLVLDGELTIEVEGTPYVLGPGDLLSLASTRLHKIWNYGSRPARAIWFNLEID